MSVRWTVVLAIGLALGFLVLTKMLNDLQRQYGILSPKGTSNGSNGNGAGTAD